MAHARGVVFGGHEMCPHVQMTGCICVHGIAASAAMGKDIHDPAWILTMHGTEFHAQNYAQCAMHPGAIVKGVRLNTVASEDGIRGPGKVHPRSSTVCWRFWFSVWLAAQGPFCRTEMGWRAGWLRGVETDALQRMAARVGV